MLKNRFFKSTQGVPYELAVCTVPPTSTGNETTTFTSIIAGASTGNFFLLRQNPTSGVVTIARNDATGAAVFRTGAYKSWPHQLAWCVDGATDKFYLTSQFVPERCDPIEEYTAAPAVAQKSTMTSSVIPVGVNQELFFKLVETTPGNIPLPSWEYTVLMNTTVNEAAAWTYITTQINKASDGEWFAAVAGSNGITITGSTATSPNQVGRTFKLVATLSPTKSDPIDYGVTFTTNYTTSPNVAASLGVGTVAMAEDMFTEALVRQGIGHFYTQSGTTAAEFGVPGSLASIVGSITGDGSGGIYNIYKISGYKSETSKTPMGVLSNKFYIFILVDADSTDVTNFKKQFGGTSYNL
jgi:hypothetical protein